MGQAKKGPYFEAGPSTRANTRMNPLTGVITMSTANWEAF
jgi:hypothetical protein